MCVEPLLPTADPPGFEVNAISCSTREQAHALLEFASFQTRWHGLRKMQVFGLDAAFAAGTNLVPIDKHSHQPGVLVLNLLLARQTLEWPYDVRQSRSADR